MRLIDADALAKSDMAKLIDRYLEHQCNLTVGLAAALMPEIESQPANNSTMTIEEALSVIKTEFMKELDKRQELLDRIANYQEENRQLLRDIKALRSIYTMKSEVCQKCEFADECIDSNAIKEGKLCTSFCAKCEKEEENA